MTNTCFNCRWWRADDFKVSTGKCFLFPDQPKPRTAKEHCIFWAQPIKIDFDGE